MRLIGDLVANSVIVHNLVRQIVVKSQLPKTDAFILISA